MINLFINFIYSLTCSLKGMSLIKYKKIKQVTFFKYQKYQLLYFVYILSFNKSTNLEIIQTFSGTI